MIRFRSLLTVVAVLIGLTCWFPPPAFADVPPARSGTIVFLRDGGDQFTVASEIWTYDLATHTQSLLMPAIVTGVGPVALDGLTISPDGTKVAFYAFTQPEQFQYDSIAYVLTLATGALTQVMHDARGRLVWTPDSAQLIVNNRIDRAGFLVNASGAGAAQPVPGLNGYLLGASPDTSAALVSLPGANGVDEYGLFDRTSGLTTRLPGPNPWLTYGTEWSPDGRTVLAAGDYRTARVTDVLGGGERSQLLLPGSTNPGSTLAWSPSGDAVVASLTPTSGGRADLFVISADGTGLEQLTSSSAVEERSAVWAGVRAPAVAPQKPSLGTVVATPGKRRADLSWPELASPSLGARVLWKQGSVPAVSAADANLSVIVSRFGRSLTQQLGAGTWSWSVQAFDGFSQSSGPRTGTLEVLPDPPGAPTRVNAVNRDTYKERVDITWHTAAVTNSGPATSFTIRRSDGRTVVVGGSLRLWRDGTGRPGTSYRWTVSATNADGTSAPSGVSPAALRRPVVAVSTTASPATVNEGGSSIVTAHLYAVSNRYAISGQLLDLSQSDSGDLRAHHVGYYKTDRYGNVRVKVTPSGTHFYSWVFHDNAGFTQSRNAVSATGVEVRTRPSVTTNYPGTVRIGSKAYLTIKTTTAQRGRTAYVQTSRGGGWVNLASVRIGSNGTASYRIGTSKRDAHRLRVYIPASSSRPAAYSDEVRVDII